MPDIRNRYTKARRASASKAEGRVIVSASTDTGALTFPAITSTAPTLANGALSTEDYSKARLFFLGTTTDGHIINYQVILWRPVSGIVAADGSSWIPTKVAGGAATLGTLAAPTWIYATGGLVADTLSDNVDKGATEYSPTGNAIAWLDVPLGNAHYIQVETDLNTAASATVLIQFGE